MHFILLFTFVPYSFLDDMFKVLEFLNVSEGFLTFSLLSWSRENLVLSCVKKVGVYLKFSP